MVAVTFLREMIKAKTFSRKPAKVKIELVDHLLV